MPAGSLTKYMPTPTPFKIIKMFNDDQSNNIFWFYFLQKMSQMGQNSGAELCAYFQPENPNNGYLVGMDQNTRTVQNWELSCLQTK